MRNNRNHRTVQHNELQGYTELGMAQEALALSRRVLKSIPIRPDHFCDCIEALLIHADHLKRWRRTVERAFARIPLNQNDGPRQKMFHFYVTLADWPRAYEFLPATLEHPAEMMFAMWTLLELKQIGEARLLFRQCSRLLSEIPRGDDEDPVAFAVSCLCEAAGSYCAQVKKWKNAEHFWKVGEPLEPFGVQATEGLVKIHALRALLKAVDGFTVSQNAGTVSEDEIPFPRKFSKGANVKPADQFSRYAHHLGRVVGAKERWRFGL